METKRKPIGPLRKGLALALLIFLVPFALLVIGAILLSVMVF